MTHGHVAPMVIVHAPFGRDIVLPFGSALSPHGGRRPFSHLQVGLGLKQVDGSGFRPGLVRLEREELAVVVLAVVPRCTQEQGHAQQQPHCAFSEACVLRSTNKLEKGDGVERS